MRRIVAILYLAMVLAGPLGVTEATQAVGRGVDLRSSIVSFASESARLQFMAENNLKDNQLREFKRSKAWRVQGKRPALLKQTPGAVVSENRIYRTTATPNDLLYSQQYMHPVMSSPGGWDLHTGGSSTVIAVIDTGFALSHEDLIDRWWSNPGENGTTTLEGPTPNCTSRGLTLDKRCNNLDDDSNGFVDDYRGWNFAGNNNNLQAGSTNPSGSAAAHGTLTASLAGATGNNAKGIAGPCWRCTLMPVQALDDDGVGDTLTVSDSIYYAVDKGAGVINMSLGSDGPDPWLEDAVNYALDRNVVLVAAAGNDGAGTMLYPAGYAGVLAVGATDQDDVRASFSGSGPALDVMAPGVWVRSATWSSGNPMTGYADASGTSMSSAVAAGLAGLLRSHRPEASRTQIANYITRTTDRPAGMGGSTRTDLYGYGRINVASAVINASTLHPDGTLVQITGDGRVFYIDEGVRRHVISPTVFDSNGFRWDRIKTATADDAALAQGPALGLREGLLVQGSSHPVYVVDVVSGVYQKRHITSYTAFTQLGYKASDVLKVKDAELPAVTGATIDDATLHPTGSVVDFSGDPAVYYIDDGTKRHILSPAVFNNQSFDWKRIKAGTSGDAALGTGPVLSFRQGQLVQGSSGAVYVIDFDGTTYYKRHIISYSTFLALGYKSGEILKVSDSELPAANGAPVE